MVDSIVPSHRVRDKAREVVAHHQDSERPGKPLYLLIPGGLIAAAALVGILITGYAYFVQNSMPLPQAERLIGVLLIPYFGSLLMFSCGYEVYDWPKAIRLTLIVGFIGLAAVLVILAIVFAISCLGESKGGRSSNSTKSSGSGTKSASSSSGGLSGLAGAIPRTTHTWNSGDSLTALNLGSTTNASSGPSLQSVARCPICGIPLPGGPGSTCPNCAQQQG